MNGPGATTIRGQGGLRAVYLADFAKLSGFTVRDGATLAKMDGGGIQCAGAEAVVSNCVVTGCTAGYDGGGIAGGTVYNSLLTGNQAADWQMASIPPDFFHPWSRSPANRRTGCPWHS